MMSIYVEGRLGGGVCESSRKKLTVRRLRKERPTGFMRWYAKQMPIDHCDRYQKQIAIVMDGFNGDSG